MNNPKDVYLTIVKLTLNPDMHLPFAKQVTADLLNKARHTFQDDLTPLLQDAEGTTKPQNICPPLRLEAPMTPRAFWSQRPVYKEF